MKDDSAHYIPFIPPNAETVTHHAFVIRIGYEGNHIGWRGWIRHVRSGEAMFVQDLDALLTFIEAWADEPSSGLK